MREHNRSGGVAALFVAALGLGAGVTALPAAAQSWTDDDRGILLEYLHASGGDFLAGIEGLSDAQWAHKPGPDRWSIAEVAEHLTLTEELIAGLLTRQLAGSAPVAAQRDGRADMDVMIRDGLRNRSQRFQAPEPVLPQGRWKSRAELVSAFKSARAAVTEFVKTTELDLRTRTAPHPAFGPIDGHQWVLLLTSHVWRHLDQIAEVKAAAGYPGT